MKKLPEIKPSIGMLRLSAAIVSHIISTETGSDGEIYVLHRINDEPRIRRTRLRQSGRGEHYFILYGQRMYLADYRPPRMQGRGRIYRYH